MKDQIKAIINLKQDASTAKEKILYNKPEKKPLPWEIYFPHKDSLKIRFKVFSLVTWNFIIDLPQHCHHCQGSITLLTYLLILS